MERRRHFDSIVLLLLVVLAIPTNVALQQQRQATHEADQIVNIDNGVNNAQSFSLDALVKPPHQKPSNMTAYPLQATYKVGQKVTCYAEAWPTPIYFWQSLRTQERWLSQSFTIREDMIGNQTMRCTAVNRKNDVIFTGDFSLDVFVEEPVRDILKGPLNDAVVAGGSLSIACQWTTTGKERTQFVEYTTNRLGAVISDRGKLMLDHPNYNRYTLVTDSVTGLETLTINPATTGDGGTYECRDSGLEGAYRQSRIIILAPNSSFTTTIPPSQVILRDGFYTAECRTAYFGSVAPLVSWTGPYPFHQTYDIYANTKQAVAGLAFVATQSQDAQQFNCVTNFTVDQFRTTDEKMATNVPNYSYTTGTGVFYVIMKPTNMTTYPTGIYFVGDKITCYADAWPLPTYTWYNLKTQESWSSQSFTIRSDMIGYQRMQCTAKNGRNGVEYFHDYFIDVYVD